MYQQFTPQDKHHKRTVRNERYKRTESEEPLVLQETIDFT